MHTLFDYPRACFRAFFLHAVALGDRLGRPFSRRRPEAGRISATILAWCKAATLTMLCLIIGFTFSMAISHDLRKNYEEAEANAIGTEYVRAGLLPVADAARVRA